MHAFKFGLCVALSLLFACGDDEPDDAAKPDSGNTERDAGSDAGQEPTVRHVDRAAVTTASMTGSLDYSKAQQWACRPDIEPNECHRNLDATEVKADNTLQVIEHERAEKPAFDCFYVYPTVYLNGGPNMLDFNEAGMTLVLDSLLSQAARFNSLCELYVPLYRQAGLTGTMATAGADMALPLQDVRDAFEYYLEHDNHGRNFVLLGHSQGTFMLSSMIQRDIDEKADVRAKLIAAVMLGGQPYTPPDKLVGGMFKNIPVCSEPDQTGCFLAYVSYASESPPPATAVFGKVGEPFTNEPVDLNGKVACTDPAKAAGNTGRFKGSYFPLELRNTTFGGAPPNPLGITTPFVLYREMFRGDCKYENGVSWLEVRVDRAASDMRTVPPYRNQVLEALGFGLHLVDFNVGLGDLLESVKIRAAAKAK